MNIEQTRGRPITAEELQAQREMLMNRVLSAEACLRLIVENQMTHDQARDLAKRSLSHCNAELERYLKKWSRP